MDNMSFILSIIAISVSALGVIATSFGTWYSFKAYTTAKDIFEKGLQINDDKILNQICLELTTSVAIPFKEFLAINKTVLDNELDREDQRCLTVKDNLTRSTFTVSVPFYYAHIGDVFEAIRKHGNPYRDFIAIGEYISTAEKLSREIDKLSKSLKDYLDESGRKNPDSTGKLTLSDYFSEKKNKLIFDNGVKLVRTLKRFTDSESTNGLPNWLTNEMKTMQQQFNTFSI